MLKSFLSFAVQHELKETSFISSQKVTKTSFVNPSVPGDYLFCILIKKIHNSFSEAHRRIHLF